MPILTKLTQLLKQKKVLFSGSEDSDEYVELQDSGGVTLLDSSDDVLASAEAY
jgi:hypothetical protein